MVAAYPAPEETVVNRPMLAAWREHGKLLLQHCLECHHVFFYPRCICPRCWSQHLEWREACGAGKVETFSLVRVGVDEAFRQERNVVVLAEVSVDEGASLITRLICSDPSEVEIGKRVNLYAEKDRERYPLPVFVIS